jgi:CPA2 family monovalent cation:H+ antiporter-2
MAKGLVRTGVYCAAVIAAGALAAPALLRRAEGTGAEETLLIAAVGLCLGAAGLGSALGVSPVLGAFLAGAIVAGTPQAGAVARRFAPLRDLFTAVFFVTVGMRISPATIAAHPGFVAMVGAVALGGKIVSASLAAFLTGYAPGTALRTGLAMAQVGEFSFILAALALELPEARGAGFLLFAAAGAVSAAGAGLAPVLLGAAPAIERGIERRIPRPVAVFAAVYQGWVRALKDRAGRPAEAPFPRAEALRFLLFGAAFTGGLAAAAAGAGAAEAWIRGRFDLPADPLALYWAATALAALPFLVGAAHAADGLVWRVAETYFPDALRRALRSEAHREAARRTVRFLVWTAASLVFLFVGAPFLPLPVLAVVVLTLFGAGSVALGGAIRRLNDRLQTRLFAFFDGEPSQAPSRHDLLALLREHYPGDVDVLDVLLPARPTAANLSIRDLALRSRTGATVVGIARETGFVPNPPPETALLPGDILFLLGETEELRAAAALLQELSRLPPPGAAAGGVRVEALAVEAGSALIGRTLHEAALPARTGASILVIRRGEETIAHPPPEFRLQAGNVVLVFGTPAQVDAARAAFRGPEPPTETN